MMLRRPRLLLLAALVLTGLASTARAGTVLGGSEPDSLVVLSGVVHVERDHDVGEVVVFHGPVTVDGTVHGDVVAFDGAVVVNGLVTGSVISLNGSANLASGSHVQGDLVSRETASVARDATVDGTVRRIGAVRTSLRLLGFIAWWIPVTFSTLFLGLLLLWWFPSTADAVARVATEAPGPAAGWGLLVLFGLPILAIAAVVTLVGIPLGVGLLFAFGLLYATGYVAGAWIVGRLMVKAPRSRVPAFLAGWAVLRVVAFVPALGGLSALAATVLGFGALAVAAYRSRRGIAPPPVAL